MFRQTFSASSRALRAAPRLAAAPKPFVQSQFAAPAFRSRAAAQPVVSRWYSEAKQETAEEAKTETPGTEEKGEAGSVAELKKALETKDAEAREWKVRDLPQITPPPQMTSVLIRFSPGQMPSHRRRLPQPPGSHPARGQDRPRLRHPEVRQGSRRQRRQPRPRPDLSPRREARHRGPPRAPPGSRQPVRGLEDDRGDPHDHPQEARP